MKAILFAVSISSFSLLGVEPKVAKQEEAKDETRENLTNALVAQLASLSPGGNELNVDYDGQSRRLMITVPKKLGRQGTHPVLFCFHGAGGKADGPSRDGVRMRISAGSLSSVRRRFSRLPNGISGTVSMLRNMMTWDLS